MKTPDPQLRQQVVAAKYKKYDEAFNKNDAAAVVGLFTEDAVFVTPTGPVYGREAIEKCMQTFSKNGVPVAISACPITILLMLSVRLAMRYG
jgi:uncharacterized protein (TIGR02246 family)